MTGELSAVSPKISARPARATVLGVNVAGLQA